MNQFWLNLLGIDTSQVPVDAQTEFTFLHEPHSWKVFLVIGAALLLIYGVFWLYRREMAHVSRRARIALGCVRALVLVLIILILLGPALAYSVSRPETPFVVVMVDDSASMGIRDSYRDPQDAQRVAQILQMDPAEVQAAKPTRAQVVNALIQNNDSQWLKDLTEKGKVRIFTFSRNATLRQSLEQRKPDPEADDGDDATADVLQTPGEQVDDIGAVARGEPIPPITAEGQATNLAQALREAMRSLSNAPVAGIVVITDGQNTEGDEPVVLAEIAQREDVPLFTIGVGDVAEPRNVRVAEVWAPESVFQDDPFMVQAQVTADGVAGSAARVELFAAEVRGDGEPGDPRLVEGKTVAFVSDAHEERLSFEYTPEKPGDYIFTVRVEDVEDEIILSDNASEVPVKVLSDKARVLLIAGGPSWEYRLLTTLLMRDKTTELSTWLQSLDEDLQQFGNTPIATFPSTAEELFEYDVIVMLDPDPAEISTEWLELLEQFVSDHGGGLMWVAGPKHTARFLTYNRTEAIRTLLPVETGRLNAVDVESLVTTHTNEWPLQITADGADHAMMRMEKDTNANRRLWEAMPGIYWSFPARRAKLGSTVLMEHSDPRLTSRDGARPLLVAGQFGPGRTVYMGFSGTWRWRKLGEKYFDQFWIQSVRYLVEGRLMGGKRRGRIGVDQDIYSVGQRVQVTARLLQADYEPYEAPTVNAVLKGPGGETSFEMRSVPNEPGQYQGTVIASQVGLNEVIIRMADLDPAGASEVRLSRQFRVTLPQVEFVDTRLNRPLLQELADRSDGQYFEIDQVAALAAAVPMREQTIVIPGRPIELWDNGRVLGLLALLLTIEWAFRKRLKLM